MRRLCKLILMTLVVVILAGLSLAATAEAAEVNDAVVRQTLQALEISSGDEAVFSRASLARMLVQSSTARNSISPNGTISPFADVSFRHPAAGYIRAAAAAGYVSALPDGRFHPDDPVTGGIAVKSLLALLGYGTEQYGVDYWQYAIKLGLLDNLSISSSQNLSTQQANRLFYNGLKATNAGGKTQIEALGFVSNGGVIDMQSIISGTADGPVTIYSAAWYSGRGLRPESLIVYRNDQPSSLEALQTYDVVYYNANMNTAWAYSDKVSGVYKSASPSRLSPSSINISGMEYALSEAAAAKLASSNIELGENLILLLGSDGVVADILRQNEIAFDVIGFATASDKIVETDSSGSSYNIYTLTLLTVDGSVLTYEVRRDYSNMVGRLVKFSYSNGEIGVSARTASNLSGGFEAATSRFGELSLAADVLIMEVYGNGAYEAVYLPRLDGLRLSQGQVLHYAKNSGGEISAMFISGVTGDALSYGIITEYSSSRPVSSTDSQGNTTSSGSLSCSFSYIVNGKNGNASFNNMVIHAEKGPAALTFKGGQLDGVKMLTELRNVTLDPNGFVLDSAKNRYLLSGNVSIYQYKNGEYMLLSMKQAMEIESGFHGYYDKSEAEGGRIRILVAK